ncbi:MAG: response regulator [Gammaproteobacteria bacterium]|jgi:two-component system, response regulator RegA|nr:response regulator [Gammaproteobacteria bacterium]MBU2180409.1 response regulator [Gammaproteobacteria bacterium]MBU2225194.1 response regulator [Gammaproteobacteria bacterium]MBU2280459.1 response regulator [Gammaproteobacteria bacterium]MBU2427965.1 response regulator [Gammaproteobacteria bacterium]
MHIVLMDDDETLVRTLSRRLTQAGHQIDGFVQPVTVQTLIELNAQVYLLDLRFGSQSGLSFVAPLRQHCPNSRILIMTGFASIATAVQAVKLGADDYLTKPIDFSLLLSALTEASAPEIYTMAQPQTELLSTDQLAWEHIQRILQEQDGNISQTARLLGMHRRTLQRKLGKHRP